MRTAVLGLGFLDQPERLPELVADVSRITHRDTRSVAGGVAIAKAAQLLATMPETDPVLFCPAIAETISNICPEFATWVSRLPELVQAEFHVAFPIIAWAGMRVPEFDKPIITPFVIPTVLASLWSLFRFPDSWSAAVANVIKLGGDVDTLGAIVGALAGIRLGVGAIPAHLVKTVQDREKLEVLAVRYHELASRKT